MLLQDSTEEKEPEFKSLVSRGRGRRSYNCGEIIQWSCGDMMIIGYTNAKNKNVMMMYVDSVDNNFYKDKFYCCSLNVLNLQIFKYWVGRMRYTIYF